MKNRTVSQDVKVIERVIDSWFRSPAPPADMNSSRTEGTYLLSLAGVILTRSESEPC